MIDKMIIGIVLLVNLETPATDSLESSDMRDASDTSDKDQLSNNKKCTILCLFFILIKHYM